MYKAQGGGGGGEGGEGPGASPGAEGAAKDENVVDAEFSEVDDQKKGAA
jgi:hypothetical protein